MRHIFVVSDATGRTAELVVQAALTQFDTSEVVVHKVQYVRDPDEVVRVVEEAQAVRGIIVFTLVVPELRKMMLEEGMKRAVPTIDILGPILTRLTDLLKISPMAIPGLFRHLDEAYFQRIEAIDYTVKHDDGRHPETIPEADVILLGVSRTSKTPISIYLAYRGFKVANVPVVRGIDLPPQVYEAEKSRIVGLKIRPERLLAIRKARAERLGMAPNSPYTDIAEIQKEIDYSLRLFREMGIRVIDVTSKSIEESATIIMELVGGRRSGSS